MANHSNHIDTLFEQYRAFLWPYAYNILGDSLTAEDVIQEILNQYFLQSNDHIQSPQAYLVRSVINRSINEKKKLQVRDKAYNGQWLPTPAYTEEKIYHHADRTKILNYTVLVLLERLNAKERAVYILREAFDFAHSDVAEVLELTVDHARQLYKRARQKLEPEISKSFTLRKKPDAIMQQLADAILQADVETVKRLLADDVKTYSDGGTQVQAARNVVSGQNNVYKLLSAIYGKFLLPDTTTRWVEVNHMPAILFMADNRIYRCMVFEINEDVIEKIYIQVNPDKLLTFQE